MHLNNKKTFKSQIAYLFHQIIVIYNNTVNIWAALSQSAITSETYQIRTVTYVAYSQLRTIQSTITRPDPMRFHPAWSGRVWSGRGRRRHFTVKKWNNNGTMNSGNKSSNGKPRQTKKNDRIRNAFAPGHNAQLRGDRNLDICINYVKICAHALENILSYIRAQAA